MLRHSRARRRSVQGLSQTMLSPGMSGVPRERAAISKFESVDDAGSARGEIAGAIDGRVTIGPSVVEGSIFQISLGEGASRGGVWATAGEPTVINSKIAHRVRW